MEAEKNFHVSVKIGEGIFLTKDVAEILRLPYYKVRYSMNSFWHGYSFGEKRNKAVNFYSLIEFFIYYHLREQGLTSQAIKKVHSNMVKELDTPYPFAHYKIRTDKKSIWYEKFDNLIKVDGKDQFDFKPILDTFLTKIDFDKNNLAERYFPLEKSKNVVVDPKHQFGQPTITGTNIKTKTIYNLYKGGEPSKSISNLYNLPLRKVQDAIFYHKKAA